MAEANRDEARRCLQLSRKLLTEDELDLSLKYAEKSLRLYASEEAEKWLAFIRQKRQTRGTSPSTTARTTSAHDHRAPCEEKAKLGDEVGTSAFTKEQVQQVKSFMKINKDDYYGVLGLRRGSDEMEIKKAYRRVRKNYTCMSTLFLSWPCSSIRTRIRLRGPTKPLKL